MERETQKNTEEQSEVTASRKKRGCNKRRWIILTVVLVCIVAGTVGIYRYYQTKDSGQDDKRRPDRMPDNMDGLISGTGVTAVGVTSEEFPIDFLEDTDLYVEEVYLTSGDEVMAGTRYIKFTDASIADARKELEDASLNASIAYRNSVISTNESKIKAEYTYKQTILAGEQAQAVYDDKIAELTQNVQQTKEAYEEAQDALEELQNNLSGGYQEEFEIDEKKQAYEDNKALYHDILDYYNLTEEELTESTTQTTGNAPDDKNKQDSDIKWQKSAINLVKEEYEESKEEYEKALSDLDEALEDYEYQLKKAQNDLDEAQEAYEEAQLQYEKESLSAKTALETAKAQKSIAKADYETELTSLDEELSKLAEAQVEATDNLAVFEETIGDGYLYTAGAGTILRIMAEEDKVLSGGNVVLVYQNAAKMTVNVSVSQEYISQLTVGEAVYVNVDDCGEFNGMIASINPVSSSDSKISVAYTVEISLEGDISELTANLTANVIFGKTIEEVNNMQREMNEMETKSDMAGGRTDGHKENE